jgi:hypothetical protein
MQKIAGLALGLAEVEGCRYHIHELKSPVHLRPINWVGWVAFHVHLNYQLPIPDKYMFCNSLATLNFWGFKFMLVTS